MNEILGSDLLVDETGDLVIINGDFEIVEGMPCLNQDIAASCQTFPGDNVDAPYEGVLPANQISDTVGGRARLIRAYEDMLASDPRIIPSSISVEQTEAGDTTKIAASFMTIDNQIVENFVL